MIDTKELRRHALASQGNEKDWIEVSRSVVLKLIDRIEELEEQRKPIDLDPAKDRWYP